MSNDQKQQSSQPDNRNAIASVSFRHGESQTFGGQESGKWSIGVSYGYTATLTQLGVRFHSDASGDSFTVPMAAIRRIGHPNTKPKAEGEK